MGTVGHENHTFSPVFSRGDGSAPDTAGSAVLYGCSVHISERVDSMECGPYKEKRTLPGTAATVNWSVCVAAPTPRKAPVSVAWFGNINPIPFRWITELFVLYPRLGFGTELSYLLGPTDPCSTAVHMEPFSTSAFKVLV